MKLPSIKECIARSSDLVAVSDSPRLDVELLLAHVLERPRVYLFTWPDATLTTEQEKVFTVFFNRRLTGEPIAHIIGMREFWSLPLEVNKSTLIPRPDTELLVESALNLFIHDAQQQPRKILDLGTGTGAIALALASEKPDWYLWGVDNSMDAVALAEKNCIKLQYGNVRFFQSDWFAQVAEENFDVILSNPPYIDPDDSHLTQGDIRFEPRSALVAANHGLADINTIVSQSWNYLSTEGYLLIEHGYEQGASVRQLFAERGFLQVKTLKDIGGNDRVTFGKKVVE